jgi:hypothetical protein
LVIRSGADIALQSYHIFAPRQNVILPKLAGAEIRLFFQMAQVH